MSKGKQDGLMHIGDLLPGLAKIQQFEPAAAYRGNESSDCAG